MVYIPKDIVERLDAIDVYDVAERLDINVHRNLALCFIHDDHHKSLNFKRGNNSWKCFVCGIGGRSIDLVRHRLNCSFLEACDWLSRNYNIPIPYNNLRKVSNTPRRAVCAVEEVEKAVPKVDEEVLNWIINNARLSEQAKHFLFADREYSEDVISSLKIGSISDAKRFVLALIDVFPAERCLKAGVLLQGKYGLYPVFRVPCLLFPYYDIDGNICNIQSRFLGKLEKGKNQRFNNCKGLALTLFNLPILKSSEKFDKIYVAEGVTDCFAYLSEGKNAIAIPGAGTFRPEFADFLRNKAVFIYPDNDDAGQKMFEKMRRCLKRIGVSIHNTRMDSNHKDYSEFYKEKRHEKNSR